MFVVYFPFASIVLVLYSEEILLVLLKWFGIKKRPLILILFLSLDACYSTLQTFRVYPIWTCRLAISCHSVNESDADTVSDARDGGDASSSIVSNLVQLCSLLLINFEIQTGGLLKQVVFRNTVLVNHDNGDCEKGGSQIAHYETSEVGICRRQ
jgi:hypothetical protein